LPQVLFLAYGNLMRDDDGLGWRAADKLRDCLAGENVKIIRSQQLTPEMAETASHYAAVIFVDAEAEGRPGEVRCEPVIVPASPVQFSHQLSPGGILALCQGLYGAIPRCYSVTMSGASFDHAENLSGAAAAAFPEFLRWTQELVRRLLSYETSLTRPESKAAAL
jgi:hydrogenase maturation protease